MERAQEPRWDFYTANKRPIVILYDGWNSSLLNAYLGQYMLEAMGYRVQVVARIDYVLGPEFYSNAVDLEFEILPDEFGSSFNQLTQVDRVAVSLGPLGYNKGVGLYIPKYVLDKNPTWSLDFWRFLLNPSYRSIFPAPGSTPRALVNGGLVCNGMPGLCMNGTYTPKQCQQANSTCIELWHIDPTFSPAIYQRLIDGLQLPVVIKFLGSKDTAKSTCQAAINQKKTVFFYYWTPTLFVAKNQLTNVLFPRSNSTEYAAFTNDNRNVLTSEPQSGILQKLASSRFVNDFPELLSLFTKYQLPDNQINYMLKTAGAGIPSQAVCQWFRANQALWMDWIPPVPKSVVSCPLGMGRYLVGIVFTCVTCPKGTYNWISNSTTECTSCPENFDCPGGSEVHVLEGMWMALPTTVTPVSYICPHQEACCTNNSCPALTCAPQFTGKLCTECLDKSMYLWGGNCYSCNSGGGTSLYLVIFGALLCTLALLALPYEEAPTVELLFFYFQVSRYILKAK
ncbi:hypothetical protein BCR33DRAFT_344652 [Rhizoclosmatium globosum]|uniref:ABC-type glycine betaine transport system substrate-binding domain-containing protein n=1 Tax=Rhizoclosmatium globosum TaxID=329046 RepID=A0A1Y2C2R8_9FUNG|nr:hypothetical protein BCR33DRAFT_344652 [Rhizoclosmatium globosum]|eukprot:ORY41338.1 hypothetical protein BCR33DRAFT_344652 [Rhizoclosmatium globosum]